MTAATLGRAALYVELDGKAHLVALPQDHMAMLVKLAGSLCDGGTLKVLPAPGIEFKPVPVEAPK